MDLSSRPLSSSMLPPFQLRNIKPSSSTSPRASQSLLESSSSHEHLVEITAPEYDSTVSDHPEATLKYVDDDDGEVVTVGTSLELSERLREPIPKALERAQLYHLFDIDRKEHIVNIWQSFAERTAGVHNKEHLNGLEFHRSSIQTQAIKPWGQDRKVNPVLHRIAPEHVNHGFKYDEADDRRQYYFRACDPPQLQSYELRKDTSIKAPSEARYPFTLTSRYDQDVDVGKNATAAIPLTREGTRQAAGESMPSMPTSTNPKKPPSVPDHPNYHNRWASYDTSALALPVEHAETRIPPSIGIIEDRQVSRIVDGNRQRIDRTRHSIPAPDCFIPDVDKHRQADDDQMPIAFVKTMATSSAKASNVTEQSVPSNLLQVFNSEFNKVNEPSKDSGHIASEDSGIEASTLLISDMNNTHCKDRSLSHQARSSISENDGTANAAPNVFLSEQTGQSIKKSLDDITRAVTALQLRTKTLSNGTESLQHIAHALESGLYEALLRFDACLKDIAYSAQKATDTLEAKSSIYSDRNSKEPRNPFVTFSKGSPTPSPSCSPSKSQDQLAFQEHNTAQKQSGSWGKQATNAMGLSEGVTSHRERSPTHMFLNNPFVSKPEETCDRSQDEDVLRNQSYSFPPSNSQASDSRAPQKYYAAPIDLSAIGVLGHEEQSINYGRYERWDEHDAIRVPRFPPLPAMKPLLPSRSSLYPHGKCPFNAYSPSLSASGSPLANLPSLASPPGKVSGRDGGVQPLVSEHVSKAPSCPFRKEPSRRSFNRMTGLDADAARFDTSTGRCLNLNGPGKLIAPSYRATAVNMHDRYPDKTRRPYSTNYDGIGRMPWHSFSRSGSSRARQSCARNDRVQTAPWNTTSDPITDFSIPGSFPSEEHPYRPALGKAEECAKQLRELGFGSEANGGEQRLMVYAQAADGNLADAIDMIDEEQKAYGQRS